MKKITIAIILFVVAALGGWYLIHPIQLLQPSWQPADLLPQDTLLSIEMVDVEKNLEDLKSSRLGKNLAAVDFSAVLRQLGTSPGDIADFERSKATLLANLNSPVFNELFGQDTTIALLPPDEPFPASPTPEYFLNALVIISRPKHNTKLLTFVAQTLDKDLVISEEHYHHHTIKCITAKNSKPIYCTTLGDLLVIGTDSRKIRNSLDLSLGTKISLSANTCYQKLQEQLKAAEAAVFTYADSLRLMDNMAALSHTCPMARTKNPAFEKDLASDLKGVHAIGAAFYNNASDMHSSKILCLLDPDQLNPFYQHTFSIQPNQNQTLSMIPADPLIYYWTNTVALKAYINHYVGNGSERQLLESELIKNFHMDADTLMHTFGEQLAFILDDIDTSGFFPVPEMMLMAQVTDEEAASSLLRTAFQRPRMNYLQEDFNGITIHFVELPLQIGIKPAYAFMDGFCILASTPEMIKHMAASRHDGACILDGESFQRVNNGLTEDNNTIVFIQSRELIGKLQGVIGWGGHMLAMRNGDRKNNRQVIVKEVVQPILDGLKTYKTIGMRTFFGEDTIQSISVYQMESAPQSCPPYCGDTGIGLMNSSNRRGASRFRRCRDHQESGLFFSTDRTGSSGQTDPHHMNRRR